MNYERLREVFLKAGERKKNFPRLSLLAIMPLSCKQRASHHY
jgi:hypothetical protein